MHHALRTRRTLALILAGTALGAAAAFSAPALASGQGGGGALRAGASIPWITVKASDYTTAQGGVPQELGNSFGTRAAFNDQYNENALGTVYSTCSKVEAGPDQLFCTSLLKFGPQNQVTLSVVVPLGEGAAKEFDGTITGGNYAFEGASGTAHFTLKDGNYEVIFP